MDTKTVVQMVSMNLIMTYTIPTLQRNLNKDHINDMVEDQKKEFSKNNCFSMLQSITVAKLSENDTLYVLDGQHRIKAFEILGKEGYPVNDVCLPVVIYKVKDKAELSEYYNRINKNMPIHPLELCTDAWDGYGKLICQFFTNNYPHYFKQNPSSRRCYCPHISLDQLKNQLMCRKIDVKLQELGITADNFIKEITKFHDYTKSTLKANSQLCKEQANRIILCEKKAADKKCEVLYLGVWRQFQWLDIILHKLFNPQIKSYVSFSEFNHERKVIPAVIREKVWRKHAPNVNHFEGECYVCNKQLDYRNMECGHIVAHSLGGKEDLDNLMPICKTCNREMGIMNLNEYKDLIERFAPINSDPMDTEV